MAGSRMFIYKQDPSVKEPGMRSTYIHTKVLKGPQDELIRIADVPPISPNKNNDFLVELKPCGAPESSEIRRNFDAIHTYAVCRQVLTMYQRAFNRLGVLKKKDKNKKGLFDFRNKWGKPLEIHVRAFKNRLSASYTPELQKIYFGFKKDVYTCRSFDIIAHETGHAVLNAIWQGKEKRPTTNSIALEEAFCDLTAIFTLLAQMDMCEAVIAFSKGNLRDVPNGLFISSIAEEIGQEKYERFAIRDISVRYRMNDVLAKKGYTRYDLSMVFSSAVYNFLADIFNDHIWLDKYDPAETLFWLGRMVTEVTLGAFYNIKKHKEKSFKTISIEMLKLLKKIEHKEYHESINTNRKWELRLLNTLQEHQIL